MPRYHQILSYTEMTHREGLSLQKGMNFRVKPGYSILLMSVRKGAPYQDQWHEDRGLLEYEGHDLPRSKSLRADPKTLDQPMRLPSGKLTENGKFYEAALNHRDHGAPAEIVQVYEKIADGIRFDRRTLTDSGPSSRSKCRASAEPRTALHARDRQLGRKTLSCREPMDGVASVEESAVGDVRPHQGF